MVVLKCHVRDTCVTYGTPAFKGIFLKIGLVTNVVVL